MIRSGIICRTCRQLWFDQSGSTATIFAVVLLPALAFVGAAIDTARWRSASSHMEAAVDAGVLAGAVALKSGNSAADAIAAAERVYAANSIAAKWIKDTVRFKIGEDGTSITAEGTGAVPTVLLKLIGIDALAIGASPGVALATAEISRRRALEISLMLDVSGSMCNDGEGPCTRGSKIDALKTSVNELIDRVLPDGAASNARIALVPFSRQVRMARDGEGGDIMNALTDLPERWTGWYRNCLDSSASGGAEGGSVTCNNFEVVRANQHRIMPCVTERHFDTTAEVSDEAPGPDMWLNAHNGNRTPFFASSLDTELTRNRGLTQSDPSWGHNYNRRGTCSPETHNNNVVVPLTSDKAALKASVATFTARGGTAGAMATAMSWYMLSPRWAHIWPEGSKPSPYFGADAPAARKVAVLMTDGAFNTFRSQKDRDQQMVSDIVVDLCTNMKAAGVEIFTVGYDLAALTAREQRIAENTLKACGNDISYFYNTLTEEELQAAYRDIGRKLYGDIALRN